MKKELRVLMIEDSEDDAELVLLLLRRNDYAVKSARVDQEDQLIEIIQSREWDIILSDYSMPNFSGMDALQIVRSMKGDVGDLPFLVLSGTIGEEIAVMAMKNGANDYLMKNNMARLIPAIERELREYETRKQERLSRDQLKKNEEQFRAAHLIQKGLFPNSSILRDNLDVGGESWPADAAGGDYFDFIPMGEHFVGVVIGDVSGHGIGPALLMAATRAYIRAFCQESNDPGEILNKTNLVLNQDVEDGKRFVTLILGILNTETMTFVYANAGHPEGFVLDTDGSVKHSLKAGGVPLAIFADSNYPSSEGIQLVKGDTILLITDGIYEAVPEDNDDFTFGFERALDIVISNRNLPSVDIVRILHESVIEHTRGYQEDDITAIVGRLL